MLTFVLWGLSILILIPVILILQPLIYIIPLKLKYGSKAVVKFLPPVGLGKLQVNSVKEFGDSWGSVKAIIRKDPTVKFLLTNMLNKPAIMLLDHTYGKQVMQEHQNYEKLSLFSDNRLFEKGLLQSVGLKWKHQRSMLTKSFSFEKLKQRVPLFNDVVREFMSKIDFNVFEPLNHLSMITGEVIIRSFFSSDMIDARLNGKLVQVELTDIVSELAQMMRDYPVFYSLVNIFGQNVWNIYPNKYIRQVKGITDKLLELCEKCINSRLEERRNHYLKNLPEDQEESQDFLDVFLKEFVNQKDQQNGVTIEEVVSQFLTFFFAGTDTTAHTVATVLYYLGLDQEAQDQIRVEVSSLIDRDGNVPYEELNKFDKTTAFIKECFRFRNPAIGLIPRKVSKDHYIKDLFVKKGWYLSIPIMAMNQSESQFENADQFDWKRWLDNDPVKPQQDQNYVFVPFSAGGRNCIGQHMAWMETKIILAHLLKTYRFEVDQSQKITWNQTFLYTFQPQNVLKAVKI